MAFYFVREIVTYGGFFGGEIVSFTAHTLDQPDVEQSLTIDQSALTNVGGDRYRVTTDVVLDVQYEGERITTACIVAAKERAALRKAISENPKSSSPSGDIDPNPKLQMLDQPRLFAHHCAQCSLWILGEPQEGKCRIYGHAMSR